jgi:septal ring factor EnvC (AmiA/AmiB activator)
MPIELLWLIPIIALSAFLFWVAIAAQKRSGTGNSPSDTMANEVMLFNSGKTPPPSAGHVTDIAQKRLSEIEGKLSTLSGSMTDQQQIIEQFKKEATASTHEISDLKRKLSELHKEYDLVLSENYSLRAKVKILSKKLDLQKQVIPAFSPALDPTEIRHNIRSEQEETILNMRLYDDTRVMSALSPDEAA